MARGQLLSLILARQHQKVADPWHRTTPYRRIFKTARKPETHILIAMIER